LARRDGDAKLLKMYPTVAAAVAAEVLFALTKTVSVAVVRVAPIVTALAFIRTLKIRPVKFVAGMVTPVKESWFVP
jgi:hypothetical protein